MCMQAAFDATVLRLVDAEIRSIKVEYHGVVSDESIDVFAGESLRYLQDSKVPQFVPLFVGRSTRQRLREITGLRRPGLSLLTK